jgi:uncharacterized RDD family membrane protein YckC
MSHIEGIEIRTGALRRLGSLLIDVLIISLVVAICVALLNAVLRYAAISWTIWLRGDWIVALLGFFYCVTLETRFGVTMGKHLCKIRVADIEKPAERGIPLGKAVLRNFLIWPSVALFSHSTIAGLLSGINLGLGTLVDMYCFWILIDVSARKDPIYDRIAGTAVLESVCSALHKREEPPHVRG